MPEVKIETYARSLYVNRHYLRGNRCLTYSDPIIRQRIDALAKCWIDGRKMTAFSRFSSRMSWYNRQFFLKLETDGRIDGQGQSEREWHNWEENKSYRYSKYLVPVLAHGVLKNGMHWVVQPKLTFLNDADVTADMERSAWQKIRRVVNTLNLWDVGEQQAAGWAIDANTLEPVIYDYGF